MKNNPYAIYRVEENKKAQDFVLTQGIKDQKGSNNKYLDDQKG